MNGGIRGRYLALLCLLPFAVFFVIFQIAPLAWVAINSVQSEAGWGVENFSKVFASKFYLQALQRSERVPPLRYRVIVGLEAALMAVPKVFDPSADGPAERLFNQ